MVGRLVGRFSSDGWVPIRNLYTQFGAEELIAYYQVSDIAPVTLKLPVLFASRNGPAIQAALLGAACAALASYFSVRVLTRYFKTRTLTPLPSIVCSQD